MMLKLSSRLVFNKTLPKSWNFNQNLLKAVQSEFSKPRYFQVHAARLNQIHDYEFFHEEFKNLKPKTVIELFDEAVQDFGNRTALMHKKEGSNEWTSITYGDYKKKAEKVAKAFIKLGLEERGRVAVLAFNSPEWFISAMGVVHAGGQITGIYTTNSSDACHYVLENSSANIVVVDTDEQLGKILRIKDKLPKLRAIVKTLSPFDAEGVLKWSDLEDMNTDDVEAEYRRRLSNVKPSDYCSISYTSGTTGNPKGVILTHDNLVWEIDVLCRIFQIFEKGNETGLSYLPLAHMTGQLGELMMGMWSGSTVYFADKDALKGTLIDTLRAARPTFFISVPRVYEKFQERLMQAKAESKGLKNFLLSWAQRVTLEHHTKRLNGGINDKHFSLQYELAKRLILSKVKANLGFDRCKYYGTGSAPISYDTTEFFMSLDIPLQEVYGLTETSGISFVRARWHNKLTTLGKGLPGLETKIANPDAEGIGEICMRGRNVFVGYLNDLEKTRETIDEDGWFHSGDVGVMDGEGFLTIKGRIKELIVTAGGENVPYLHVESLVKKECAAIANTFLVGDKRKFLSMLLTLRTEIDSSGAPSDELAPETLRLIKELELKYTKLSEILSAGPDSKVIAALQAAVDRANQHAISNAQKVQKFAILPNDFSIQTGELNAAMKLKRNVVLDKYKTIIDNFYA